MKNRNRDNPYTNTYRKSIEKDIFIIVTVCMSVMMNCNFIFIGMIYTNNRKLLSDGTINSVNISMLVIGYIGVTTLLIVGLIKIFRRMIKKFSKHLDILERLVWDEIEEKPNLQNLNVLEKLERLTNILAETIKERKLETSELAYRDKVTQLPNRNFLEVEVNKLIKRNHAFVMMRINIDEFEHINAIYGYEIGDYILKEVGQMISKEVGQAGFVVRYAEDEFIGVYTDYESKQILQKQHNGKGYLDKEVEVRGIKIHFAIGCISYPGEAAELQDLINKSQFVMKYNKKNKNSKNIFFDEKLYAQHMHQIEVKNGMKEGLRNEEFEMYFQPIRDNQQVVKCEALVRWVSPSFGEISPVEFIKYAEETGDIIELGYWIIDKSFRAYNLIKNKLKNEIELSINLSGIQLARKNFIECVEHMAQMYNINRNKIIFELTENVLLQARGSMLENMEELKALGFKLALDDFGTGYSSFSYLEKFKLDIIKLDKSFIDNKYEEKEYYLVKGLIGLSHLLNLEVVAEGVETKEQYEVLREIGCNYYQGYYFSKPLPLKELCEYMAKATCSVE